MNFLKSTISLHSDAYSTNRAAMQALVDELNARQAQARAGGGERGAAKFRAAGKLLPRERVEWLLDPGTPFLELSPLAAEGMYNGESPGASQITGIGVVSGVECLVFANDATVKGGAVYPMTLQKSLRAQQIAFENRLPCLSLVESARTRSSSSAAAPSPTRPACRPRASPRWRWSSARPPPAGPTSPA